MARLFDDANNQYLTNAASPVSTEPITLACWFNSNDGTIVQDLIAVFDGSANVISIEASGGAGGDPVVALSLINGGASFAIAETSTGYTANTWHHACGVFASHTSRIAYIDGGSAGSNTDSIVTPALSVVYIGVLFPATRPMSGMIAEAAIWNVALTAAEVAVLATGVSPLMVRPESLVAYWPLVRDLNDRVGGLVLTTSASAPTVADHIRVFYPVGVLLGTPAVAGGGSTPQAVSGTLTSAGSLTRKTSINPVGVLTSAGSLLKKTSADFAGTLTSAGVLLKKTSVDFAGTLTSAGSLLKKTSLTALAGVLTSAGTLAGKAEKILSGTLTTTGTVVNKAQKRLSGVLTSSSTQLRKTSKHLSGVLEFNGSALPFFGFITLAGVLTMTGRLWGDGPGDDKDSLRRVRWWIVGR